MNDDADRIARLRQFHASAPVWATNDRIALAAAASALEARSAEVERMQARAGELEAALQTAIDTTSSITLFYEWHTLLAASSTLEKL